MEQLIIPHTTHKLPIDKIDTHALYVMEKLRDAGFLAYLVGGSVRDLLLDRTPKDFDISTSAKPEEIKALFRNSILIGRRFRLAHIRFGKKILEVSTFRSGDLENDALIIRDNQWGYPEEDALRRDFTINGLFYDASNLAIIDYVGGYEDIKRRYLRTIGSAHVRFKQDPVRMLRLLKFQARFGFEVDPDAHIALVECREEITKSSPARVLEEMLRMLESAASHPFIRLLTQHGLMSHLIPPLSYFLEKETRSGEIYAFLDRADASFKALETIERPVLVASLLFPLFDKHLFTHFLDRGQTPHLGQVQSHARDLIERLCQGFFVLPRKLRITVTSILADQYRLTPFQKRRSPRLRVPRDPDFGMSIKFLQLRAELDPTLREAYAEWSDAYLGQPKTSLDEREGHNPPAKRKRRRRR